jgi:NADPH:quinone reductase-like Zn-dependent oxidoreductase
MKAAVMVDYGDVDKLVLTDVPEPEPGAGELKIRVAGASINPVDYKLRRGELRGRMPLELPTILGRDVSGEVTEVGPGVRDFRRGDHVMGLVQHGYAEYVVAPATGFARIPNGSDEVAAAALPLVALTGAQLVDEAVSPRAGDILLVTGAVGSVGRVAVFAAKQRGAQVIAGVRAAQREQAESLEADGVVALDDERDIARLPPLDAIADAVDGQVIQSLLPKLKPGAVLGTVVGEPANARERGITVRSILTHSDPVRLAELAAWVANGDLAVPISKLFALEDVRAAQQAAEQHAGGKVLLVP